MDHHVLVPLVDGLASHRSDMGSIVVDVVMLVFVMSFVVVAAAVVAMEAAAEAVVALERWTGQVAAAVDWEDLDLAYQIKEGIHA